MAISNYGEFREAVADWLNRSDLEERVPDFIALATATLNRMIRDTRMVGSTTLSLGTNKSVAIPADMLEPLYLSDNANEDNSLEQISPEQLVGLRQYRTKAAGVPRFYCVLGRNIEVTPTPAASTTLSLVYYQAIPAFTNDASTNWMLTYSPDIYLYTALYHAQPFLKADDRVQMFESSVASMVRAAIDQNDRNALASLMGPAATTTDTRS